MLRSPSFLTMTRVRISITRGSRTGPARVTHGSRMCHSESDVNPRHLARAVARTRPQYVATRLIIDGADAADARATWLPITFLARLSFQRGLRPVSDYGRDYTSCWDLHEGSLAPPVMQWHTVMKGGLPPASPHRGAGIVTTPYSPATPPTRDDQNPPPWRTDRGHSKKAGVLSCEHYHPPLLARVHRPHISLRLRNTHRPRKWEHSLFGRQWTAGDWAFPHI